MKLSFSFITLVTVSLVVNFSCRKSQHACMNNCVTFTISGQNILRSNGTPIAGKPVEVKWAKSGINCFICSSINVASGNTDANGKFNFTVSVDTSLFKTYFLSVSVPIDTNYLTLSSGNFNQQVRMYDYNPILFQNIIFESFEKAILTLNINRTLTDNFTYFSVEHFYDDRQSNLDYIIVPSQAVPNVIRTVPTSTNIYTKIRWKKSFSPGQYIEKMDSLVCTKNGPNAFTINY
jgi:hypothetical protein